MHPETATGLYWSKAGIVACAEHAPDIHDLRWTTEQWEPLPESAQGVQGLDYCCPQCDSEHRFETRRAFEALTSTRRMRFR